MPRRDEHRGTGNGNQRGPLRGRDSDRARSHSGEVLHRADHMRRIHREVDREIEREERGEIHSDPREEMAIEQLKLVLADTFVLYMKTYAVHWNYEGENFFSVHKMTEEHYQELAESIDDIAERIRAKGDSAPVSLRSILNSSDLEEMDRFSNYPSEILKELIAGHRLLASRAQEAAGLLSEINDTYSADMMSERVGAHQKAVWMLTSLVRGHESKRERLSKGDEQ